MPLLMGCPSYAVNPRVFLRLIADCMARSKSVIAGSDIELSPQMHAPEDCRSWGLRP